MSATREMIEDAKTLQRHAAGLTYNDTQAEAAAKHRLYEIAMRIETGYYGRTVTPPAPPEGYKLVPVEPTEAMLRAACDCQDSDPADGPVSDAYYAYRAMLAAAPQPGDKA